MNFLKTLFGSLLLLLLLPLMFLTVWGIRKIEKMRGSK